MKNILIAIIFIFINSSLFAQINDIVVSYSSTGNLQLGSSIDYRYPERGKDRAITNDLYKPIDGTTANSTTFSGTLISDVSKLYSKLNITYDVTASGSYLGFLSASAEMHAKLDLEDDYTNNKLYYLIEATSDYGREGYGQITLTDSAQKYIRSNPQEFIRRFGTHFAKYQTKTASVYLLYEINTSNKYSKNSLYTKFAGKFDFSVADVGGLNATSNMEFSLFKTEARSLATVKVKFLARSASGLTTIADFVDTAQSLNGVVSNLKKILKDPAYNIGAIASYTLTSFQPYGLDIPIMSLSQQRFLQKFNNIKVQLIQSQKRFNDYISKISDSYKFKDYYKTKSIEYGNYISQLDRMESDCNDNKNCDTTSLYSLGNIPIQWLEEIVDIDSIKLLPSYESMVDQNGNPDGKIIHGVRVVTYGKVKNYEYFSDLRSAYLNQNYEIIAANNSVVNSHNLDTSNSVTSGLFKSADFIFLVDASKPLVVYERINGKIVNNNNNLTIANNFLEELKTRTYFLETTSKDNLKFYTDLGVLNMTNIVTVK